MHNTPSVTILQTIGKKEEDIYLLYLYLCIYNIYIYIVIYFIYYIYTEREEEKIFLSRESQRKTGDFWWRVMCTCQGVKHCMTKTPSFGKKKQIFYEKSVQWLNKYLNKIMF